MTHSSSGETAVRISSDRKSVTARLFLDDGYRFYKDAVLVGSTAAMESMCCQTAVTPCPDGYSVSAAGFLSVKSILSEGETPDSGLLLKAADSVLKLLNLCRLNGTDAFDCLFDYSCVFEDSAGRDFRFMYMPGLAKVQKMSACGDFLYTVLLNIYTSVGEEQYRALESTCKNISSASSEDEIYRFTVTLKDQLEAMNGKKEGRIHAAIKRIFMLDKNKNARKKSDGSPEKQSMKSPTPNYVWSCCSENTDADNSVDRDIELVKAGDEVKIGRDRNWADLCSDSLFVSRAHLLIRRLENGDIEISDRSSNGTLAEGVDIKNSSYIIKREGENDKKYRIVLSEGCSFLLKYARRSV